MLSHVLSGKLIINHPEVNVSGNTVALITKV